MNRTLTAVILASLLPLAASLFLGRGQERMAGGQTAPTRTADRYVLPSGAGTKDGSSWANALDASKGGLQKGWDLLGPGATLFVGSGTYKGGGVVIETGGEPNRPKTLAGKDTGAGLPLFAGTFDRTNPAKTGETLVSAKVGASHFRVQNLRAENYRMGFVSSGGRHQSVVIDGLSVTNCREGISLDGGADAASPDSGSQNIEIKNCTFQNFTKRGVRLKNGNHDVRVTDCVADAGGKPWATEPFQMGFQVGGGGAPEHHITFTNCVAKNSYDEQGGDNSKYWNADGFCAEKGTHSLRYVGCRAFDNTDGGWDDKSTKTELVDCIALRNKRNFRFWGEVTMTNCLGAYTIKRGGSGGADGIWTSGKVIARYSTFHNNGNGISTSKEGRVELYRSIVSHDKEAKSRLYGTESPAVVEPKESVLFEGVGEEPRFVAPKAEWSGKGDAFDSQAFGRTRGYNSKRRDTAKK